MSQSPNLQDLREQTLGAAASAPIAGPDAPEPEPTAPEPQKNDPRKEEYTFPFSFKTARGVDYEGEFTSRILTVGEERNVDAVAARLGGGVAYESLSFNAREMNGALAHMAFCFWSKPNEVAQPGQPNPAQALFRGPEWAKNLEAVFDTDAIVALWEEVMAHHRAFFRLGTPETAGAQRS